MFRPQNIKLPTQTYKQKIYVRNDEYKLNPNSKTLQTEINHNHNSN